MKAWNRLTLQARLGLFYGFLLVVSVILVGGYSYRSTWQLFIRNKSSHLRAMAKPIIEHWITDNKLADAQAGRLELRQENALMLARDLTSRNAVAIVLDRHGKVVANGKRLAEEPDAPAPEGKYLVRALAGENEITYRSQVDGRQVLVLLIPLRVRPGSPRVFGAVQISAMLTDINDIVFRHGTMLLSLVAIVLILGIAAGFWLIRTSLKDLYILVAACNQISKGDLSRRVAVKNRRDEIGQLANSFNRMIDRLEATFASQQRFAANAAHELLTPLTGLRGSLEVLLRGAQDDPRATARLSKGMYGEVNRLIRLCEQLLALSRLENCSNVHMHPIVLSEFFSHFENPARLLAGDRSLIFRHGPYAKVLADPDLLQQILLNLLSNALRYSPPETPIVIKWKLRPEEAEIMVADHGRGIDAKALPHICEPFYQGEKVATAGEKGLGLGLSLVKSMVAAQQGKLRIESEPGKGTKVYFTLALA